MASDADLELGKAVAARRVAEGLPADGGQGERWVKTKLGPIPFAYPNTQSRRRLLLAHDLHHLLTGYGTDLVGEAEAAAWELGSGVRDRTAVRYALRVFGFSLPWRWRRSRAAFVRGRHCGNLIEREITPELLDRSVGELRSELGLDRDPPAATAEDEREFRRWARKALAIVWGPLLPLAGIAVWWWRGAPGFPG